MINARKIFLHRAEGKRCPSYTLSATSGGNPSDVWREADSVLYRWSITAPKQGYDKCDFQIEFDDGAVYNGRFDLKHCDIEIPDLSRHVSSHVKFFTGKHCPHWMDEEKYKSIIKNTSSNTINEYTTLLNNYHLGERLVEEEKCQKV